MASDLPTIAIVGAGASGTVGALHLLATSPAPGARLVLIDPAPRLGAGVAFSTPLPCHLLNVPAGGMSAFEDDAQHFVRWLDGHGYPGSAADFVPRRLYGAYLRDSLRAQADNRAGRDVLDVVPDEVIDIEEMVGGQLRVVLARSAPLLVEAVVLSTGTVPRRFPVGLALGAGANRCIADPWAGAALSGIDRAATVTLIGTGLTAIDTVLALDQNGHYGPVHAISRHGLLPRPHPGPAANVGRARAATTAELARRAQSLAGTQVRDLFHQFRLILSVASQAGIDGRAVVDMLRPVTASLWAGLNSEEKLRFCRHLERLWNVHRHRMAPRVAARIDDLRDAGLFHVHSGRVLSVQQAAPALRLEVQLSSSPRSRTWSSDWLVNCTGTDPDVFAPGRPLMDALSRRGLCVPGPIGMGIATDSHGRPLGVDGRPVPWLWALGSLRQGDLLESTAMPEVRRQAQEVAVQLRHYLDLAGGAGGRAAAPAALVN